MVVATQVAGHCTLAEQIVSIPGGFSWSLRHILYLVKPTRYCSFNPWRVFLVVATSSTIGASGLGSKFQSLAGFLGRCDIGHSGAHSIGHYRFNPWRVFLVVATQKVFAMIIQAIKFQSLAGFLGRCDGDPKNQSISGTCGFNPWRVFLVVATLVDGRR